MIRLHLTTALRNLRRSPFQALAAISVLTITFFVATILSLIIYSSNQLLNYFATRPQIIAFIKSDATEEEIKSFREKIENDKRIKNLDYVTKEEALEIYKNATSDNPLLAELVDPSIFPASLEFSVTDLEFADEIIKEVKSEKIVETVGFTASIGKEESLGGVVEKLRSITTYIRVGGVISVAVLGLTSFLVLTVVIGMRIAARKEEIEILSLLGATPGFIRLPVMIEAFSYSFLGVLVGWVAAFILILYLTPSIVNYFGDIPVVPRETGNFFALLGIILLLEMVSGFIISFVGGFLAIARAHRARR